MRTRTGSVIGDPTVYDANTCTDILGSENRYQAYVNVPGVADLRINSFRAIYNAKVLGDLDLTVNYGFQGLEQSSQYDIDQGYNYAYGMSFNWNDLDVETNVLDAYVSGTLDNLAYVVGGFYFNEDMYALANFHADLQGTTYFWQPERVKDHFALYLSLIHI